ncbi:metallophosphoesterase [Nitrosopumilus ureiphilus]|nr:metallophosphoesterase [Nitrosopumilus ureiphilus]
MNKTSIVSISDIHIGNNSIACWYNKGYHEPYLNRVLEYVISQKDNLKEFIILGDLFDFWTYPPDVQPPTVEDIIKANPGIFANKGTLDTVVSALDGNVSYVVGNHDISITQADLDKIPLSGGYKITKQTDEYTVGNCLFTHGHLFTIFNAPDPVNPIPLGHFVTRLIAYYVQQQGTPAWQITGFGAPAERQILLDKAFLPALKFIVKMYAMQKFDASTISDFVDIWVQVSKFPTTGVFKMADGSTKTIDDVKSDYANLFTTWVNKYGVEYVQKSIYTDGMARSMSWFTQQAALKNNADLTITGHTHWPTSGVKALADDVNCGFECFAEPDSTTSRYSFAEVTNVDTTPTPTIYDVTKGPHGGYLCNEASGIPQGDIVFILPKLPTPMDYSCFVRIVNNSSNTLTLTKSTNPNGKWVLKPSASIAPNSRSGFWLQDSLGIHGADGSVTYSNNGSNIVLNFDCPTGLFSNKVSVTGSNVSYRAKIGNGPWKNNSVDPKGHPLSVEFTVS